MSKFTKIGIKFSIFIALSLTAMATTHAGTVTYTADSPTQIVGQNVQDFSLSIAIQTASDFSNGSYFNINIPVNFPYTETSDLNDGKLGLSAATIGGHDILNSPNVTYNSNFGTFKVTFDNVADIDGLGNPIANGDVLTLTFTTAADSLNTAYIIYDYDWDLSVSNFYTPASVEEVDGGSIISISPATLTSTDVDFTTLEVGASDSVSIYFTSPAPFYDNSSIYITFPEGFDVSGANSGACPTMDGTISTSVNGQVVRLNRNYSGTTQSPAAETCTIQGIVNPLSAGSGGTYEFNVTNGSGYSIATDLAVLADIFTDGSAPGATVPEYGIYGAILLLIGGFALIPRATSIFSGRRD